VNSEHDRPRCPECGRFVSNAKAWANDDGLTSVTGECKTHATVTLGRSWWDYDLWFTEEAS